MLAKFRAAKAAEIAALEANVDALPTPWLGLRPSFSGAISRPGCLSVIAEYKRASPSRGVINPDLTPEDCARSYAQGGAAALSVLTESTYFQGDLSFLDRMAGAGLPLLRKDFLFSPLQVAATAATKASAFLLIARMFDSAEDMATMIDVGAEFHLDAVCEIFNERDLDLARSAGATIIQVNNRDLDTLVTDLDLARRLIPHKKRGEIWIAASGMETGADLRDVQDRGFDAALVGTALMRQHDPGRALSEMLAVLNPA